MPRSRVFLVLLVTSLLGAPLACAQGDPPSSPPAAATATDTAPTLPPASTPTPDKPTPANPDDALPPEVDAVSPDKATVGSIGPSIVVTGNNFVSRSIVQLDGAPLASTFISGTELRATIPTSKLAAVATLHLSVGTSPPGGGASKEVTFTVENPGASLTAIAPMSVVLGAGATSLHVTGSGFVSGAKVVFGTTDLATTFTSGTALDAAIPAALLAPVGSVPVKVVNPSPGGGPSTTIAFTIANPNAALQSVSPQTAYAGAGPITLAVNGSGFIGTSTVLFNGSSLATTFASASQLTATVPAALLANAGDFPVAVNNPPPGGGVTTPLTFHVMYPAPLAASLSPSSAAAGAPPTDVTVTGSNFYPMSQITFDGAPAATSYLDATHVKATLTAAQLVTGAIISVRVVNPSPGGGPSSALSFTVNNAAPSITSLSPSSVTAGSPDKTITITGAGFLVTSGAQSNGLTVPTTFVSPSQLTAVVPSSHLLNPGTVSITVVNPAPGGGTSAAKFLTVGCDTSGVDVSLLTLGQTTVVGASWATAPSMSRFSASGSCATTSIDLTNPQPGRYWVVQNMTGAPVTLSAWADCTTVAGADAFLTFYKRPTPPASDAERLACFADISEGINGANGYSSPDAGGSMWCPGLTKANGGGMTLAVCEKAIVHAQPWSGTSTTYPPPPSFKIKAE